LLLRSENDPIPAQQADLVNNIAADPQAKAIVTSAPDYQGVDR
jgi:hypothetical protein